MKRDPNRTRKAKKSKKKRIKISAITIWIGLEVLTVFVLAVAVCIHMVYGGESGNEATYSVPTPQTASIDQSQIELPVDLMAEKPDDVGMAGDLYSMDYPEDIMNALNEMSIEQKVDMLFVTTPESLCGRPLVTVAGNIFSEAYNTHPVTGLIFTDANFTSESAGMGMLASIRKWSRDKTGMNVLLGYTGETTDATILSDKGINLYCLSPGEEEAGQITKAASDAGMVSAFYVAYDRIDPTEDVDGLYIVSITGVQEAIDLVNTGRTFLYMTRDFMTDRDGMLQAVNEGRVPGEALDKAAGYALSIRQALTNMRPEEFEKAPVSSKPKTSAKKASARPALTPEQQAVEAQKEPQKQMEEAIMAMQKQAEAAAAAAQGQQ